MRNLLKRGFTLIELLIVIAVISILAAVVFVALDPLTRFQDARDARRFADVSALVSAIRVDQVDNGGSYINGVMKDTLGNDTVAGDEYMISNADTALGCNPAACPAIAAANDCVNLQGLADEGYLGALPVSPNGTGNWTAVISGYYLVRNPNNSIKIGACEAENTASISVTR